MLDFLKVACVVPDIKVADCAFNTQEILNKLNDCAEDSLVVLPELCITGYTAGDLFFDAALQQNALKSVARIMNETAGKNYAVVLGAPLVLFGQLYNCAVVLSGGRILGIVPKTFIPVYNEFYEKRWFSGASDLKQKEVYIPVLSDGPIPVGTDLVFDLGGFVRFGVEVCEDLWAPLSPGTFLALNGAEVIVNVSASNETISKRDYRTGLVTGQSAKCISGYVYVSAGCKESTTDLIFSGHSLIAENGTLLCENQNRIDSDYILRGEIDLGRIRADRAKIKTFKDCAALYGAMQPVRSVYGCCKVQSGAGKLYPVKKYPFIPSDATKRIERCMDIFKMQVAGLKKRIEVTGAKAIVVGVSGGLDSTLALLVSHEAMKQLNRPFTDLIGITMPAFGTTDRTFNNSIKLMESLEISYKTIPIKESCLRHMKDIGHDESVHDVTYENVQARERTQVLMDYANKMGGFVVGTGDLSELALGWCTYNADHMSMYGVNAGVPKTLVKWMIDALVRGNIFPKSTEVLKSVIDTPISPELLPPDENGKIAQKTEDLVGPYVLHDFFMYHMMRFGFAPTKIYELAKTAFDGEFDDAEILKWLKTFYRRFFSQQFKRSCLPDGVKVGSICLSPRGDWRMPSDASASVWLAEIEKL